MTLTVQLKEEAENADALIESYTEILANRDRDDYEFTLNGLTMFYRTRAVARFLLDADVDGFRTDLVRSARCQVFYFCHIQMGMKYNRSYAAITNDGPFFDALAAGSERDAVLLTSYQTAVALPKDFGSPRYPYNMFLRSNVYDRVRGRPSYEEAKVEEWLAGANGNGARVAVARAMESRDAAAFREAMDAFADEWSERSQKSDTSTADQLLSVEALGLCWLASAKRGIKVDVDHPLFPKELQRWTEQPSVPDDVPVLNDAELAELEEGLADIYGLPVEEVRRRRPDPRV